MQTAITTALIFGLLTFCSLFVISLFQGDISGIVVSAASALCFLGIILYDVVWQIRYSRKMASLNND